jgi:acylphosphatase
MTFRVRSVDNRWTMNDQLTLVRRVLVEGSVQGVGYREFTRRAALRLNVSGWVRNRADGAVEALLQGSPTDVDALIAEMRKGPRFATVDRLRLIEDEAHPVDELTFVIRSTL